ncbi:MAG: hypothetical protein AMXMBFR59_19150 [Rhodanobacteraceae bacterium]
MDRADGGAGAAAGDRSGSVPPGFVARVLDASPGAVTSAGWVVAGRVVPLRVGGTASGAGVDGRSAAGATAVAGVRCAGTGLAARLLAATATECVAGSDGVDSDDPAGCGAGDSAVPGSPEPGIATGVVAGSVIVPRGARAGARGVGGATLVVAAESGGVAGRA